MNEILKKKLMDEKPLTPAEMLELDVALEEGDHLGNVIEDVSAVQPPLNWRSGLSQRIYVEARQNSKRSAFRLGATVVASVCTLALMASMVLDSRNYGGPSLAIDSENESVEERMVQLHHEVESQASLGVNPPVANGAIDFDWASLESR